MKAIKKNTFWYSLIFCVLVLKQSNSHSLRYNALSQINTHTLTPTHCNWSTRYAHSPSHSVQQQCHNYYPTHSQNTHVIKIYKIFNATMAPLIRCRALGHVMAALHCNWLSQVRLLLFEDEHKWDKLNCYLWVIVVFKFREHHTGLGSVYFQSLFFFLLSLFHVCRYFTNVTCMNVCFSGTPLRDFKPLLLSCSKGSGWMLWELCVLLEEEKIALTQGFSLNT